MNEVNIGPYNLNAPVYSTFNSITIHWESWIHEINTLYYIHIIICSTLFQFNTLNKVGYIAGLYGI